MMALGKQVSEEVVATEVVLETVEEAYRAVEVAVAVVLVEKEEKQ